MSLILNIEQTSSKGVVTFSKLYIYIKSLAQVLLHDWNEV